MSKRRPEHCSGTPSRRGLVWLLPLVAAVLAGAAYFGAIDNPFVYDDHDTVLGNRSLADLSNIRFILVYSPFRPLVNASYALDRWLWGYRPLGYHLTNIGLHMAAVVLLYAWIRRILFDSGRTRSDSKPARGPSLAAFTGAALFAVHPMQTEAVAYVSGRSELMCAVWFIAALLLARDAILSGSRARPDRNGSGLDRPGCDAVRRGGDPGPKGRGGPRRRTPPRDRKSTRLNSSHSSPSRMPSSA